MTTLSDGQIEDIARVAHEANRAWCYANGDDSQRAWNDAEDWQRASCVDGVRFVLDNPEAGDAAQHENWRRMKLAEGWTYGDVKRPDSRQHPCMVPFDDLPAFQRAKDQLFRSIVLALAAVAA